jgi:hypothetical protein
MILYASPIHRQFVQIASDQIMSITVYPFIFSWPRKKQAIAGIFFIKERA